MMGPLAAVPPVAAGLSHPVWRSIAASFRPEEFRHPELMDVGFLLLLHRIRMRAGVPMRVVSDYRDPGHNTAVGGARRSAHMERPCRAVDLRVKDNHERARIILAAAAEGIHRIGVYPAHEDRSGTVHIDASTSKPQPRIWTRY